jgi:hypothetical protein
MIELEALPSEAPATARTPPHGAVEGAVVIRQRVAARRSADAGGPPACTCWHNLRVLRPIRGANLVSERFSPPVNHHSDRTSAA